MHHSSLNWRLAIDLFSKLKSDTEELFPFKAHWENVIEGQVLPQMNSFTGRNYRLEKREKYFYFVGDKDVLMPVHPLQGSDFGLRGEKIKAKRHFDKGDVRSFCPYAFQTAPIEVIQQLR